MFDRFIAPRRKHRLRATFAALWLAAGLAPAAHAVGRLADIRVIDRDTGQSLPVHAYRGEHWVEGRPGARYAVRIVSRHADRLLAVTSVDGVNVVSGETAAWEQTGYVFSAWQNFSITGWRKSSSEVAAFEFAAARDSYAGRTGRPGQVGVIGVALFRERAAESIPMTAPPSPPSPPSPSSQSSRLSSPQAFARGEAPEAGLASADNTAAPAARAAPSEADAGQDAEKSFERGRGRGEKLGTAHGARETSHTSRTDFTRLRSSPDEIIRIRYDSRERLIAAGVIREAPVPWSAIDPFPASVRNVYVPDPPLFHR